jgi:HlyD family secretion protein
MKKSRAVKVLVVVVFLLVAGLAGSLFFHKEGKTPRFRTETITRGDLSAAVTATGTMNAVVTVLVGTQVSGTIKTLYVDYNSSVKKGQLLAQIDPASFNAQKEQARANLLAAQANVAKAEATLADAKRTLERNKTLFESGFIARGDLDTAQTNAETAAAQVAAARAQAAQTGAALDFAETNLRYTRIVSPVDGTVISRNVDVGQTVAASFQTPTLFSIAQDLKRMQIDTNVDEADIGRIREGQPVTFTVDAYPDMTFKGRVAVIRNAPITVQNVVTYIVVVNVDNSDLKLKPGMTANVSILYAEKKDVLRIPNAALRFRFTEKGNEGIARKGVGEGKGGPGVWVLDGDKPKRSAFKAGISDGMFTEVVEGGLREGQAVILESLNNAKKTGSQQTPPFRIR